MRKYPPKRLVKISTSNVYTSVEMWMKAVKELQEYEVIKSLSYSPKEKVFIAIVEEEDPNV